MINIRIAREVVNYLYREAWEQIRRQNRVTFSFKKEIIRRPKRPNEANTNKNDKESLPRRAKIYVPKIIFGIMLATATSSTSIQFKMGHVCKKLIQLFMLD